jgi:hypothetical protein
MRIQRQTTDLFVAQLHGLLLEVADVPHGETVEHGSNAGDAGHGRHRQVVQHHVRHYALHNPSCRALRRRHLDGAVAGNRLRRQVLHIGRHKVATIPRALHIVRVRYVVTTVRGSSDSLAASIQVLCLRQTEEGSAGVRIRRDNDRAEEINLSDAGLQVSGVELLDTGVEVADTADHSLLPDHFNRRGDGQREEGEEEVHDVLARLRKQQPLRLPVDVKLHAQLWLWLWLWLLASRNRKR